MLDALERTKRPSRNDVNLLALHAEVWSTLGLADRARELLRTWRRARASAMLDRAEATFVLSTDPAAASARLRAAASRDAETAALLVVGLVTRGELTPAADLAESAGWFARSPRATAGRAYALWALVLLDELERARAALRAIARTPARKPEQIVERLRNEAMVAAHACEYAREEALLDEAIAVCREHGLGMALAFAEVALAAARARAGDMRGARGIVGSWKASDGDDDASALATWRDLARMDLAALEAQPAVAARLARKGLRFAERTRNAMLACAARFALVLHADAAALPSELAAYRALVRRYQVPYHLRRLRTLESLVERDVRSMRDVGVVERTRTGATTRLPLVRIWTPRLEAVGADLYFERDTARVYLSGTGPFAMDDHPVLRDVLGHVLAAPGFCVETPALFRAVWGIPYDPLLHEGKVHVTLHRLRRWLVARERRAAALIDTRGGRVAIAAGADVRTVEITPG